MKALIAVFIIVLPFYCLAQNNSGTQKVREILEHQSQLWNEGDIEGFMQYYWPSEELVFLSSDGPIYGWEATLQRYKKAYPDRAAMGQLRFDLIEVERQSRKLVSVIGRFHLTRPEVGDLSGYFLLMVKKIKGRWLIIADHTSSSDQ